MPTPNNVSWLTISSATPLYISAHSVTTKLFMPRVYEKWWRETCQSTLWNFTLSFLRPARVPMNQLQYTDIQNWPGKSYKCERRNYGIKNTGMGNLILWDQTHRIENMFSWHVRNSCQKFKWQNLEPLKSCPVLRIFAVFEGLFYQGQWNTPNWITCPAHESALEISRKEAFWHT